MLRRPSVLILAAVVAALVMPFLPARPADAGFATRTIVLRADGPSDDHLVMDRGGRVSFHNESGQTLTVTGADGAIDSGPIPPGGSFHLGLDHPGSYEWDTEVGGGVLLVPVTLGTVANQPVNLSMPDVPFPPRPDGDVSLHPDLAAPVSRTRLLVRFTDTTTAAEAESVLRGRNLDPIGTLPHFGIVLASLRVDQANHNAITQRVRQLRARSEVAAVVHDHEFEDAALPAPSTLAEDWSWQWAPPSVAGDEYRGTWGLELARVPAAWNLNEAIIGREGAARSIAVIDSGFESHEDLSRLTILELCRPGILGTRIRAACTSTAPTDHGNHVTGIIGADHDNRTPDGTHSVGVSGVDPFSELYGISYRNSVPAADSPLVALSLLLDEIEAGNLGDPVAVNLSLGLNLDATAWRSRWADRTCGPGDDDDADGEGPCLPSTEDGWRAEARNYGELTRVAIETYVRRLDDPPLFVFAAGNTSNSFCVPLDADCAEHVPISAQVMSFGAAASAAWDDQVAANPILVVESIGRLASGADGTSTLAADRARSLFSNVGGDLSAPGLLVSTESSAPGGEVTGCTTDRDSYCYLQGTSMAAPFVTGVAGLLKHWDPSLTTAELKQHLLTWSVADTTGGAAPRVDAYAALTALPGAARALADLNDPSVDGNRRVVYGSDGSIVELDTTSSTTAGHHTEPDGQVDMRDFRRFRDAWLLRCQISPEEGCPGVVSLDGPPDHPKFDLNLDGCIALVAPAADQHCPSELTWPRFDLNGNGTISVVATAPVGLRPDGSPAATPSEATAMTDLEVLASQWDEGTPGAEGVSATDLHALLVSGDLELHLDGLRDEGEALELVAHAPGPSGSEEVARRAVDTAGPVVLTIPAERPVTVTVRVPSDDGGAATDLVLDPVTLVAGEDRRVEVCAGLTLDVEPSSLRPAGGSAAVVANVRSCGPSASGIDVAFEVSPDMPEGAALAATLVATDGEGRAVTSIDAGNVTGDFEVLASAEVPIDASGDVTMTRTARAVLRVAEPYAFDVLATTIGASGYASLRGAPPHDGLLGPSIAADGRVAYRAVTVGAAAEALMLAGDEAEAGDPSTAIDLTAGGLAPGTRVTDSPHLNDAGVAVGAVEWYDSQADAMQARIHRFSAAAPGVGDVVAEASLPFPVGTPSEALFQDVRRPSVNSQGTVVFDAVLTDGEDPVVARSSASGPVVGPVTPGARTRVADDGTVVTRAVQQIGVDDRGLPILGGLILVGEDIHDPRAVLAEAGVDGWTWLGWPAVADTGRAVAFAGDAGNGMAMHVALRTGPGLGGWTVVEAVAGGGRVGELGVGADGTPRHFEDVALDADRPGIVHVPGGGPGLEGDRILLAYLATPSGAGDGFASTPGLWTQVVDIVAAPDGLRLEPHRPVAVLQHGSELLGATVQRLAISDPLARPAGAGAGSPRHQVAFLAETTAGDAVVRATWQGDGDNVEPAVLAEPVAVPTMEGGTATTTPLPPLPLLVSGSSDGLELLDEPHLPAFTLPARQGVAGEPVVVINRSRTFDGQPTWAAIAATGEILTPSLPRLLGPDEAVELTWSSSGSRTVRVGAPVAPDGGYAEAALSIAAGIPPPPEITLRGPWILPVGPDVELRADVVASGSRTVEWDLSGDGVYDVPSSTGSVSSSSFTLRLDWSETESMICGGSCDQGVAYPIGARVRELGGEQRSVSGTSPLTFDGTMNFSLLVQPTLLAAGPGETKNLHVAVDPINGFAARVQLHVEGAPEGWTVGSRTVTPPSITSLSVRPAADAQEGLYDVEVVARSGELEQRVPVTVSTVFGLIPECRGDVVVQVTSEGEPLAGALGVLSASGGSATTDADGIARFEEVLLGSGNTAESRTVRLSHGDHFQQDHAVLLACDATYETSVELERRPRSAITGRVTAGISTAIPDADPIPTDEPVDGLSEFLTTIAGSVTLGQREVVIEADGSFTISNLIVNTPQTAAVRLGFTAPGFHNRTVNVTLEPNGTVDVGHLGIAPQCTATVRAITIMERRPDGRSRPVPDAQVRFGSAATWTTDEDGRAQLDLERPLDANARADVPLRIDLPAAFGLPSQQIVVNLTRCGQEWDDVVIFTRQEPTEPRFSDILGKITDVDTGVPIDGAQLVLRSGSTFLAETTTDLEGHYRFEDVFVGEQGPGDPAPQRLLNLRASRSGYWPEGPVDVVVSSEEPAVVDLEMLARKSGAVSGVVTDLETGAPIPGARVRFTSTPLHATVTDEEGRYHIEGVGLGDRNSDLSRSMTARLDGDDGPIYWPVTASGVVIRAEQTTVQDFGLLRVCERGAVQGVVVNALTLDPIEDATVAVGLLTTQTDVDGRFRIDGILAGQFNSPTTVTVEASKPGFFSAVRAITMFCGAEITVDFGQPSGGFGTIMGTVTDEDGSPLVGVFVGAGYGDATATGPDGTYLLDRAPLQPDGSPRTWTVTARDGARETSGEATVASETVTVLDLVLGGEDAPPPPPQPPSPGLPIVVVNDPVLADEGGQLVLDASGSSHPDGLEMTFTWELLDAVHEGAVVVLPAIDDLDAPFVLTVTDAEGGQTVVSGTVVVRNVPPSLTLAWATVDDEVRDPDALLLEPGQTLDLVVDISDPGVLDTHTATVDWGDGIAVPVEVRDGPAPDPDGIATLEGDLDGPVRRHVIATHDFDATGEHLVTIEVCDKDGGCTELDVLTTVATDDPTTDDPPTVTIVAPGDGQLVEVGTPVEVSAEVESHDAEVTCRIDWGDGEQAGDLTDGSCAGQWEYDDPGVYAITVTATDSLEQSGEDVVMVVVYDPGAGFVTGGGWVHSPAYADLDDVEAEGRASFGFVARYLPGRSTPSGNLQFQFQEGDLRFRSTEIEWLVVTGEPRARFRGEGLLNGSTVCRFRVDAWDGSFSFDGADAFGLRIDACENGHDRYQLEPTRLEGGSIVVHRR